MWSPNMGKRSGVPGTEDELSRLTAEELNAELARCKLRLNIAKSISNQIQRKAFEKRIHRLERLRVRIED